jgi:hypothetical protein
MAEGGGDGAGMSKEVFITPPKPLVITTEGMDKRWARWLQQFGFWADSTDFDKNSAKKKVAKFMAIIGPDALDIYNEFDLTEAEKANVEVIQTKFTTRFTSSKSVTLERFLFYSIRQSEGEKVAEFFARIKLQAANCKFALLKDELVRDQIVIGMRDKSLQKLLFREKELTLEKAESSCRVSEETDEQISRMNKDERAVVAAIDQVKLSSQEDAGRKKKPYDCKRCGTKHVFRKCPAYKEKCGNCRRYGHVTSRCRVSKRVEEIVQQEDGYDSSSSEEERKCTSCVDALSKTKKSKD